MKIPILSTIILNLFMFTAFCQPPLETVSKVDLQKYSGKWYEIAHLPAPFLKGCDCITATYAVASGGNVKVYNRCRNRKGVWSDITGKAFAVNGSGNSRLKVQFFWPFRGDYYIIDLAEDYSYAIVGEPSRKYLWILSRYPQMSPPQYHELVRIAGNKGFPVEYLVRTNHIGCGEEE